MFIGHFALGLAAKKAASKTSLGTLLLASQFIDLLWPFFLVAGIEQVKIEPGNTEFTPLNFIHYPWSHSLLAAGGWALLGGLIYYLFSKNSKGSIIIGLLMISHWFLDFLTHRPDLPISFSESSFYGLGLWNNKLLTIIIEVGLFLTGSFIYFNSTKAKNKKGQWLLWSFLIFIVIIYVMNIIGPPPPNEEAIVYAGFLQWLFIGWGYWIDRNREKK